MSNRNGLLLALVALLLMSGCSDKYAHRQLESQSAYFRKAQQMLAALRAGAAGDIEAVLDRQLAPGLPEPQERGLRMLLTELAHAEQWELQRVDRWGEDLCRATIRYETQGQSRTVALLLIAEGEELYWAGVN